MKFSAQLLSGAPPRGQQAGVYPLLRAAGSRAEPGSDGWCTGQFWLGWTAAYSADPAGALDHFTVLRDAVAGRPGSRALADALAGRAGILRSIGRTGEGVDDASRALAIAQELDYPVGELLARAALSLAALYAGDYGEAVRLARPTAQVTAGIPGSLAAGPRRSAASATATFPTPPAPSGRRSTITASIPAAPPPST